jgi:hypothetical protein
MGRGKRGWAEVITSQMRRAGGGHRWFGAWITNNTHITRTDYQQYLNTRTDCQQYLGHVAAFAFSVSPCQTRAHVFQGHGFVERLY